MSFAPRHADLISALSKTRAKSALLLSLSDLVRLLLIRNREFFPALAAAAGENGLSAFGFHSGAKAEFSVPFGFTRLIGSFHQYSPWGIRFSPVPGNDLFQVVFEPSYYTDVI